MPNRSQSCAGICTLHPHLHTLEGARRTNPGEVVAERAHAFLPDIIYVNIVCTAKAMKHKSVVQQSKSCPGCKGGIWLNNAAAPTPTICMQW